MSAFKTVECRRSSTSGFSLVELMVVLTVLGILSALIVPQFNSSSEDARLLAAGRELATVMTLAYSQAVTLHRPCRLRLDRGRGRYWLESPAEGPEGGFSPLADVPGAAGVLDARIEIQVKSPAGAEENGPRAVAAGPGRSDRDLETVSFRPDGTADSREILLRDREGFGLSIEVHPITSRIRLNRLERVEER